MITACKAYESIIGYMAHRGFRSAPVCGMSMIFNPDLVDMSMRMFDKDQVGGDREISVLSSQFRILQSMTESVAKVIGRSTNIDMLDNPRKTN